MTQINLSSSAGIINHDRFLKHEKQQGLQNHIVGQYFFTAVVLVVTESVHVCSVFTLDPIQAALILRIIIFVNVIKEER